MFFFIFLGFNFFYISFPIQVASGLKRSVAQMRIFYTVLTGMMILVQGPILRNAMLKFFEEQLVKIESVILGVNFILFIANNTVLV